MQNRFVYIIKLLSAVVLLLAVTVSCSTQKAKWANIQYHNLTAHYNVWWNGNESLKEAKLALEKKVKDDYTTFLPVYVVGTKEDVLSIYPQLDRAIEKGVQGIKKHSILIKGEEHIEYVKRCYLLTAYATFYKQDYAATANTCRILTGQFAGTEYSDEGEILMARCLTMEKQYAEAELSLDLLVTRLAQESFSKKLKPELYMAMVECLVPQGKFKKAVDYIKEAIPVVGNKQEKARLYYLMAQIYHSLDKRATATKYYEKVLDCAPDYVMEFNARINIASCANLEHSDITVLEKELDKMLNDKKNEEFRDQIYYAKGEMYMGVKQVDKACSNFKKSVALATANKAQRIRSSLRLAEILYDIKEDYDQSQCYYDTAFLFMDKSHPQYYAVKERYELLTDLVTFTRVIDRNDSLISVADMSQEEQLSLINKKIEELKKREEEARERELIAQYMADSRAQGNTLRGDWYFYNDNTVQRGKETFKQRYGMRVLEDYWFLEKKGMLSFGMISSVDDEMGEDGEEYSDSDTLSDKGGKKEAVKDDPNDPHCVAYYLKDLPKTPEDRDSMFADIATSLINAGYIYNEGLRNSRRALECYLRMANDFADYDEVVHAFFQLYKIYDKQGNTPSANYYKDMVLMGFPDSDFANILRDPEYYKEIIRRDKHAQEDYEDMYALFRRRRYTDVIDMAQSSAARYAGNSIVGKFQYWEGLAYLRLDNQEKAIDVFQNIVNSFPSTDSIVPMAEAQIALIKNSQYSAADTEKQAAVDEEAITPADEAALRNKQRTESTSKTDSEDILPPEAQMFRYREKQQHFVVIVVDDKKIRATDLQYKLSDYNAQYFSNSGYKVNALMFTDSTQMLTVHRFVDAAEAMEYWQTLQQAESPLKNYDPNDYYVYPFSTQNYNTFYKRKNIDAYKMFFERYYIK